ncbi:MAG: tetratricopeptide repeat protein [Devosia sp.]
MTNPLRLLPTSLLVLALTIGVGSAGNAATPLDVRYPSITGSFLAGQQAMVDLRMADAAKYFRDASEVDWDNAIIVERAFIAYAGNGDIEQAAATARRLLELQPDNELARLVIAAEAMKQRRYDAAAEELGKLDAETFPGITGGILRAWAFAGDKDLDRAYAVLDEIGRDGLGDFLVFHRALMADVAGDSAKALEFAARAHEVDPFVARIVEAYSRMLGNAGRFDEATEVIKQFESEGMTHPLVDIVKASIEKKQRPGLFATNVQAGAAEMFHGIGVALARDGSVDLSMVFLQLGLYLDPSADVIALVIGQLLDTNGQHEAANAIYDRIPATSPMKPTAAVRVAENLDALGDRNEAIRRLGNIVRANPGDLDALSVLGDLQRTDERYVEAAETYTKALDVVGGDTPGDWRFYYVRGIAYERAKQWPKAEADFLRALQLRPDQPQVLNYLGYSWVDQGINLEPALDMIEKAVAAAPNDGYIIDSLGWAFYRLGRYGEAVEALEQAVQLRPNDPEINDHLGDAYWRAGRKLEARFQWTVAAHVDDEGNVKARVAPKLAGGLDAAPVTEDSAPVVEDPAAIVQ